MRYTYTRHSFRPDGLYHKETITLSSEELITLTNRNSREAFLSLVNSWNRSGLIGLPGDHPIYVFVAEG